MEKADSVRQVLIDADTINWNESTVYRGVGVVTGNNSSRLLMDYKTQSPDAYWEIMRLLFQPDYGAGLTHIKIEFGADVNSSSGTEPSIMRSADEQADVTRGAGFMFAADALSINPDITTDLLRWGEPKWVTDAFAEGKEAGFAARYKWYKAALDAAYDTYGMKFTHISADANETLKVDTHWIIYLSKRLKDETEARYDYGAIKIVASDEVGAWRIADEMLENEVLRSAVDILAEHYNTWANDKVRALNESCGKEVWYTEGIAPTNIARLAVNSNGSGLNGKNGALDVCNRIINAYYNGRMTMYEYQPAVSAYYSGACYFPKSLVNAQTPWNGYYEADCGIWTSAHFTRFIQNGWRYVDSACYGDGTENHFIYDTTHNYMTVTDTQTGDYTIVICNDSEKERAYTFLLKNMEKAEAPVVIWETRGPDGKEAYDANYFRKLGTCLPAETEGGYAFSVRVKPYSVVTLTTLDKAAPDLSVCRCRYADTPLKLGYRDDFAYSDEFLSKRGGAPLYTADYGGAFEVVDTASEADSAYAGGKVLMQMITADNKPTDWHFRETPNPITSLGDDRWSNYSVQIRFRLASGASDNYAALGLRYLTAELDSWSAENGYSLRVYAGGYWELKKNARAVARGSAENFDDAAWHTIRLTAAGQNISAALDGAAIADYYDEIGYAHSGRVSIGSGLYRNVFANLEISPVDGYAPSVVRVDDHDAAVTYTGSWEREVPASYLEFNRTVSRASVSQDDAEEKSFSFRFSGSHFAIIGKTEAAVLEVYVDGKWLETKEIAGGVCASRQCSYCADIPSGAHTVLIRVVGGEYTVDAVEYS